MKDFGGGGGVTVTESADKTYALSSVVSETFASVPKLYGADLVCTTAEQGYAVGDRIKLDTGLNYDGGTLQGVSVFRNGATVSVAVRFYVWAATASGTGVFPATAANWTIRIWAVL